MINKLLDKQGNEINLMSDVKFSYQGKEMLGKVVLTVIDNDIITVKVKRGKYYEIKVDECEVVLL